MRDLPSLTQPGDTGSESGLTEMAPGFLNALETILKTRGHIKIEKELSPGISQRQLRRLFNRYVGTTPKTFSRVVRFQYTLNKLFSDKNPLGNTVHAQTGYYDQAHFIYKEVQNVLWRDPGNIIEREFMKCEVERRRDRGMESLVESPLHTPQFVRFFTLIT